MKTKHYGFTRNAALGLGVRSPITGEFTCSLAIQIY